MEIGVDPCGDNAREGNRFRLATSQPSFNRTRLLPDNEQTLLVDQTRESGTFELLLGREDETAVDARRAGREDGRHGTEAKSLVHAVAVEPLVDVRGDFAAAMLYQLSAQRSSVVANEEPLSAIPEPSLLDWGSVDGRVATLFPSCGLALRSHATA
jgi:hypothetical protein